MFQNKIKVITIIDYIYLSTDRPVEPTDVTWMSTQTINAMSD